MRVTVPVSFDITPEDLKCSCCNRIYAGTLEEFVIESAKADPESFAYWCADQVVHELDQAKGTRFKYACLVDKVLKA